MIEFYQGFHFALFLNMELDSSTHSCGFYVHLLFVWAAQIKTHNCRIFAVEFAEIVRVSKRTIFWVVFEKKKLFLANRLKLAI